MDFLLVLIELFSLGVTAEALRRGLVHLMQNLRLRGRRPPIVFARIVRPMNALQLYR